MDLLATDPDDALVGTNHPVNDFHQRGLAGTVLPNHGVDLTHGDIELDVFVGHHAGIALSDSAQMYRRFLGHLSPIENAGPRKS
jgi:hypothetical protein